MSPINRRIRVWLTHELIKEMLSLPPDVGIVDAVWVTDSRSIEVTLWSEEFEEVREGDTPPLKVMKKAHVEFFD